jgi:hypothetical protein
MILQKLAQARSIIKAMDLYRSQPATDENHPVADMKVINDYVNKSVPDAGVCEWKKIESMLITFHAECRDRQTTDVNIEYKFCPFCGKLIKRNQ